MESMLVGPSVNPEQSLVDSRDEFAKKVVLVLGESLFFVTFVLDQVTSKSPHGRCGVQRA